jgi:nucleoside-diphosphate-sugar epimerase
LLAVGAEVICVVRGTTRSLAHGCRVIDGGDLAQAGALSRLIAELQPAVLFQMAGYGVAKDERDPDRSLRLNVALVAEALAALTRCRVGSDWRGVRLVQPGSALEIGPGAGAVDEATGGQPHTDYGRHKAAATAAVARATRAGDVAGVTARLFTVFGTGERPGRLLPMLWSRRHDREPIELSSGAQRRDFVYLDDVAFGLVELAATADPAALTAGRAPFDQTCLHLASGRLTSVREFVTVAAKTFGIDAQRLQFGARPQLPEELFHGPVANGRLRAALGWVPSADLQDGLERARERMMHGERDDD